MQNEFKGLRHYIEIVESAQQTDEDANTVGNIAGQAAKTAVNTVTAPVRAAQGAASWLGDKISGAWDAAKQGVQNFAQGAQQGYTQGGIDPLKPVASAQQAAQSYQQSGAAAKTPTTPEEIKAFQQANGLTADGIIGPKTLAAMKAKGMTPPAAGQGAKPAAKPAAATQTQAQQNMAAAGMAGQEMRTPAEIAASQDLLTANDGTGANGGAAQARNPNAGLTPDDPRWRGPKPAAAPAQAGQGAAATPNPWEGKDPAKAAAWAALTPAQQKFMGGADPTDPNIRYRMPKTESVGYDELERLVNLVHYR